MKEITPQDDPRKKVPQSFPDREYYRDMPLGKEACAAIGFALFIGSLLFAVVFRPFGILCILAAFMSLFFKGYRFIFVGYFLSFLISAGLLLLFIITTCGHGLRGI